MIISNISEELARERGHFASLSTRAKDFDKVQEEQLRKLKVLQAEKIALEDRVAELQGGASVTHETLDNLREEVSTLERKKDRAEAKQKELEAKAAELGRVISQLKQDATTNSEVSIAEQEKAQEIIEKNIVEQRELEKALSLARKKLSESELKRAEQQQSLRAEINQREREVDSLQQGNDAFAERCTTLEAEISRLQVQGDKLQKQVELKRLEASDFEAKNETVTLQVQTLQTELEAAHKDLDELTANWDKVNRQFAQKKQDLIDLQEKHHDILLKNQTLTKSLEEKFVELENLQAESSFTIKERDHAVATLSESLANERAAAQVSNQKAAEAERMIETLQLQLRTTHQAKLALDEQGQDLTAALEDKTDECNKLGEEVELLRRKRERADQRVKEVESKNNELSRLLEASKEHLESVQETMTAELEKAHESINVTSADLMARRQDISDLKKQASEQEKQTSNVNQRLEQDVKARDSEIGGLLSEKDTLEMTCAALEGDVSSLNNYVDILGNQLEEVNLRIGQLEGTLAEQSSQKQSVEERLQIAQEQLEASNDHAADVERALQSKGSDNDALRAKLAELHAHNDTMRHDISQMQKEIEMRSQEIHRAQQQIDAKNADYIELQKQHHSEEIKRQSVEQQLRQVMEIKDALEDKLDRFEGELREQRQQLLNAVSERDRYAERNLLHG